MSNGSPWLWEFRALERAGTGRPLGGAWATHLRGADESPPGRQSWLT